MHRAYFKWRSPRLGREMEALLFGHGGEPVILFPTSCGRFYQNEDFGLVGAIEGPISAGRYLVLCVDSIDAESWYNRACAPADRIRRHEQYESYLLEEAVPWLRERAPAGRLTLGGCSFGAFHAMNIGLRHPRTFRRLLGLGGAYDTAGFLDGHHDLGVYFHSVLEWLPNLTDPALLAELRRLEITLAVGEHDFCRPSTERLAGALAHKGIDHHLSIWHGGGHDWPVWRQMIAHYLT